MARVDVPELLCAARRKAPTPVCRPLERRIVMDNDDPVARKSHIEFQAVGTERQTVVERGNRILRAKSRSAPVRIDERTQGDILTRLAARGSRLATDGIRRPGPGIRGPL